MEANELMINDIIKLKVDDDCYQPLKVGSVEFDESWCAMYNFERREWENAFDGFGYDMIDPIPLTAEILKSNGFFQHLPNSNFWMYGEHFANEEGEDECIVYVRLHNDSYFVEITNNYNDDAMYERTLHFVHELQHALRLCGLNDLADNFKVE